ncbi:hypothetical protein ACROYT_G030092 [Oculina patagonica]
MEALMTAYRNAKTSGLRTQILSLYAFKYPIPVLMKLHEPYEKITRYQVKRARSHAKLHGPGTILEKEMNHRVRLVMAKEDHFLEFANRPYFYQDVAYGSRVLKLDSGEKIPMPNVIRTVTRSTMVKQYQSFCEEENFNPLSWSTLFKISDVRQASQRTSLQGLNNIAADGAAGFQTMERIVDDLKEKGLTGSDYRVHCSEEGSPCKDHCRKFALSDPVEKDSTEECDHEHNLRCDMCEDLNDAMNDVERQICESSASLYSKEYEEDLLYDFGHARTDIIQWKAHVLRSVNQDTAKHDVIRNLNESTVLVVMDWAMKFLQMKYREKQTDWYAKRGISWHVSTVIFKEEASNNVEVQTYAHMFDCCQQDWFAVCSIFENLLENVLASRPSINSVFLRSDEAGCYCINALVASLKDVGQRLGVQVKSYDYSEPAYSKDVCDRILCP